MAVDIVCEIEIARPRAEVAAYAADPDNATAWYENIKAVEWRSPRPLAVGSRIAFVATFLGRRIAYTYEIREHMPGERLRMSTAEGPFPIETTYTWRDAAAEGGTVMTLRNRGETGWLRADRRAADGAGGPARQPQRPTGAQDDPRAAVFLTQGCRTAD